MNTSKFEPGLENDMGENDDVWKDEDLLELNNVPIDLWSDAPLDKPPSDPPEWEDRLADEVELNRLLQMGVIAKMEDFKGEVEGTLTGKFVYDWRAKDCNEMIDGKIVPKKRWMRRSRLVAREFNNRKRDDTYPPATGCHTANLIPLIYLQRMIDVNENGFANQGMYMPTLASLDVKDAFLQVPQERIVAVQLNNSEYAVLKNLGGQRIGARAWYWFFRRFTTEALGFEWNVEQPCLAKSGSNIFMMHVDDLLFCGDSSYWKETFIPAMQSKFDVSVNELKDRVSTFSRGQWSSWMTES